MTRRRLGLLFLSLLLLAPRPVSAAPLWHGVQTMPQQVDKFFDSNGVKIHYWVEGKGEPVVLVHGFIATGQLNWAGPGVVKALAKDYRVIVLDNRGHGKSDKPHDPKKYGAEMAEDVVRLLDHLKIDKAHIVGYSMGGLITQKLLEKHPERCRTAVIAGAGWLRPGDEDQLRFFELLGDSLESGKGLGPLLIALTPIGAAKPSEEQIKQTNTFVMAFNDPKALAAAVRGFKDLAVPEEKLKANKVPALALVGSKDPLKTSTDALKERMANLKVVVIDDGDHISTLAKAEFVEALRKFLAEHK